MNAKVHHPSCSARFGGLCTGCPGDKDPYAVTPGASTVTCLHGVTHWVLGDTLEARERALADWDDDCGCHPDYHELGVHQPDRAQARGGSNAAKEGVVIPTPTTPSTSQGGAR